MDLVRQLILCITLLGFISTNLAQPDYTLYCMLNNQTNRVLYSSPADTAQYTGYEIADNQDDCAGIPYMCGTVTSSGQYNGFARNYCGSPIWETKYIYCQEPGCACRQVNATSSQVHYYANPYLVATTVCQFSNSTDYEDSTAIDYTKCQEIIQGQIRKWVSTSSPCADLLTSN